MVFFECVFALFLLSVFRFLFQCLRRDPFVFCSAPLLNFCFCNSIPIVLLLIYFWFILWYIPLDHETKTACDGSINLVIGGFA